MPTNDARDLTLRELRTIRDTCKATRYKILADEADLLLQATVDLGPYWEKALPNILQLEAEVKATLSGGRSLPAPNDMK